MKRASTAAAEQLADRLLASIRPQVIELIAEALAGAAIPEEPTGDDEAEEQA